METIDDLDESWIIEFEKNDEKYKPFYKENIEQVNIRCMYINKENCVEYMTKETIRLNNPNILSRDEIIFLIKNNKKNTKINTNQYTLLSLLKYNIDLEPINLNTFLKQPADKMNYLSIVKSIESIYLSPTIQMFHDLNEIIILFYETIPSNKNKNSTKKIFINRSNGMKNKTYKKIS